MEKVTINFYYKNEKLQEKYTSLIPRDGEIVVIKGKSYSVCEVVWLEVEGNHTVEVRLITSAWTAMRDEK